MHRIGSCRHNAGLKYRKLYSEATKEPPVIFPVVLFLGVQKWNAPVPLREYYQDLLDPEGQLFLSFVPDEKTLVIDPGSLDPQTAAGVCPDLQAIAVLPYHLRMLKTLPFDNEQVQKMFGQAPLPESKACLNVLAAISNDSRYSEIWNQIQRQMCQERKITMCEIYDQIFQRGEASGEARGEARGEAKRNKAIRMVMTDLNFRISKSGRTELYAVAYDADQFKKITSDPEEYREFLKKNGLLTI